MRILLDTNVLMWAVGGTERLGAETVDALTDPANEVLFSAASIWEIAIKFGLARADFTIRPEDILAAARDAGFVELAVGSATAATVAALPAIHRDPFDRLLVAQAIALPAWLYTTDRRLAAYSELVKPIDRARG